MQGLGKCRWRRGPCGTGRKTGRGTPEFFSPLPWHPVINPIYPLLQQVPSMISAVISGRSAGIAICAGQATEADRGGAASGQRPARSRVSIIGAMHIAHIYTGDQHDQSGIFFSTNSHVI